LILGRQKYINFYILKIFYAYFNKLANNFTPF